MMSERTPWEEKSRSSRSIMVSEISPFQTKKGAVLNSAGGVGKSCLRREMDSTVALAAEKAISIARSMVFFIGVLPGRERLGAIFLVVPWYNCGSYLQAVEVADKIGESSRWV